MLRAASGLVEVSAVGGSTARATVAAVRAGTPSSVSRVATASRMPLPPRPWWEARPGQSITNEVLLLGAFGLGRSIAGADVTHRIALERGLAQVTGAVVDRQFWLDLCANHTILSQPGTNS